MIRIHVSEAAFAAIAGRSPTDEERTSGDDRYGKSPVGMVPLWLLESVLDQLRAQRRPGEGYSETIVRIANA